MPSGYPVDAEAVVLIEVDGLREEVEAQSAAVAAGVPGERRAERAAGQGRRRARRAVGRSQGRVCGDRPI